MLATKINLAQKSTAKIIEINTWNIQGQQLSSDLIAAKIPWTFTTNSLPLQ